MADLTLNDIFNQESVKKRAREHWNYKDENSRLLSGKKYNHIFIKHNMSMNDWRNEFDGLSSSQQKLLIKSEIIRTYDSLPNTDKSKIKSSFKLSIFASKWFKLPSEDKKKILKCMINTN